jgi:hypothetical protein
MLPRIHRVGVVCGASFLVTYLLGLWVLADFVPAHDPRANAEQIAQIYRAHNVRIKLGLDLVMLAAALYLPWVATWSAMIRRMEGTESFLSKCQLLGGLASSMFFVLPALVWQVAAYRIDRPATEIRMLNDFGWILTVTPVPPFLIQFLPFAAAIMMQKAGPRLLPRWLGYASLWACVLYSPAVAAYFFTDGPLAWNGLLSFWIPLSVFVSWESVIVVYTWRLTRDNADDHAQSSIFATANG